MVLSYGEKRARVFAPGAGGASGGWTDAGQMTEGRWYPTATGLGGTGQRVLVTSGHNNREHLILWGRRNGTPPSQPSGDSLHRFAPRDLGRWDPPQQPEPDPAAGRPLPRVAHTAVQMSGVQNLWGQVYFGGVASDGFTKNETWFLSRIDTVLAPDYKYRWASRPLEAPQGLPFPRSEHTAVVSADTMMVVYGGLKQDGQPLGDVWRLYFNKITNKLTWQPMNVDVFGGGPGPAARHGHAAVADTILAPTPLKRMVVSGGTSGGSPSDTKVWELRFDPAVQNHATWYEMTESSAFSAGPKPAARFAHAMAWNPGDPGRRTRRDSNNAPHLGHVAFLYGGELGGGAYSDSLWALWLFVDGTYAWEPRPIGGAAPGNRARHSMVFDSEQGPVDASLRGRIYVLGGDVAGTAADRFVHEVDPWAASPTWAQWDDADFDVSGHSAILDLSGVARIAEIYDAATGQWQAHPAATLLEQQTYPSTFLVPGAGGDTSRVVAVSLGTLSGIGTYRLDIPSQGQAGPWQKFSSGDPGFIPATGVMYRPGKILLTQSDGLGLTKTLDATNLTTGWASADTMLPRHSHNLVLLPDGKVLVVGGRTSTPEPQIWDPATNAWGVALAPGSAPRDYHSTAILLPDGRILSAGGSLTTAEVFCPPYLFKSGDTLATRPAINEVVQRIRYGYDFAICKPGSKTLTSVSLIRPGATTHAFDQNQRYVPLTITGYSLDSARVTVSAPADSSAAPPGDYLLFLVDGKGVPSVARWLRVGSLWNEPDATRPDSVADLYADAISQHSIYWSWTVPGDDHASGQPWQHKLVHSSSPITSTSFANASPVPGLEPPWCVGSLQSYTKDHLTVCTYYYAAIQVVDESNNYSVIGYSPPGRTLCSGGGGGGGAAARQAREESQGTGARGGRGATRSAAPSVAATGAGLISGSGQGMLVADYERTRAGASWMLFRADPATVGASDAARIAFQEPDGAGGWRTRRELDDSPADLGLRSFAKLGRVILPASYVLTAVESRPPGFDLAMARHSRLGELATDSAATAISVALAAGDTLSLLFTPTTAGGERGEDCFFIASRPLTAGELSGRPHREDESQAGRIVFALDQNQPNPFAATTTIGFTLPVASRVRLGVFDLLGRRVRTLANASFPAGEHQVTWDRRTTEGTLAKPGLYFYRIEAGSMRDRKKMVLLP